MNLNLIHRTYSKLQFLIFIHWIIPVIICASGLQNNAFYKFKQLDINHGLSNNQVNVFLQDSQGFMWFGTGRGLNRFDGINFKVFRHDLNDSSSIPLNSIDFLLEDFEQNIWIGEEREFALYNPKKDIFSALTPFYKNTTIPQNALHDLYLDHENNLWFIDATFGLYRYISQTGNVDSIKFIPSFSNQQEFNYLTTMSEDSKHNIWVVSNLGEVQKLEPGTFNIIEKYQLSGIAKNRDNRFKIFIDNSDDVWIYIPGLPLGAFYIQSSKKIINYTDQSQTICLNNNLVSDILQDKDNKIWIATDHGGLNILDKESKQIIYVTNNRNNKYSISQNSINSLYRDENDIIWAGTYKKGINFYHKNLIRFKHFSHLPRAENSLPYNDVNCFAEDNAGNLWIGTNGGGLIYFNRKLNTYKTFKHDANNPNSISNNVIVALYLDRKGVLWIGTYYGGLSRYYKNKFQHYRHNPEDLSSISDDRVWEIMEDSQHNLWIGTLNGGLNLFDRDKQIFYRYKANDINSVGSNFIMSIIEDSEQNLWMGTDYGVDKLDLSTKRFYHYDPEEGVAGKLSNKDVVDLLEDGRGFIWMATRQGLNVLDKNESKFRVFTESDGLADSNIKTIQEDQQGNIWVATTNGLSKIEILNGTDNVPLEQLQTKIVNYDLMDGLQGKEFNEKAAYRTRKGELIFGGSNGFNLFIPEKIEENVQHCKIVLTNLKVFNQEVKVGVPFRNRIILEKSIFEQDEIILHHNENVFSFEVAGLDFFHPEKNIFQYRLDGFKDEWLQLDAGKDITFTNLDAGNYKLRIRVSGDGQNWLEKTTPLRIKILPPFWKSKWGILIYLLIIIGVFFILRRMMLERQRLKFDAEHERFESERIQQVDAIKTRFFTNISHEFRTPLTLIISPLEKIITQIKDENQRTHLILIHRNARRLLSMVNQLLDFRKMEVQKIVVKNSWGNMVELIKETSESFSDMAENKQIEFSFTSNKNTFFTTFDKDKTDKIISNLLVNAFKFTNEKGKVSLEVKFPDTPLNTNNKTTVQWIIRDNGIGIPPEKQNVIFERFYQNPLPGSIINQGSGIGLSMVSEYVNLMGGTIKVESILGKGSTFSISIPVQIYSKASIAENNTEPKTNHKKPLKFEETIQKSAVLKFDANKNTILLVEDNEDLRFYLKENLKEKYNILEADNGGTGWELVKKHLPQLVVSDVMIPVLNGIKLCASIKNNKATKHIPVILLTAKVEAEPELEGLESGADDYIFKPFDFRILESRIENMINSREQLRLSYQSMIGINPKNIEVNSQDEEFIKKALEVVEKNISESSFSVEDLSKAMGMSRVSLYKKMLALTNKSPIEFIRILRLKRAADLLKNSQMTVSEIAYQVGFNNPRYFSKYFEKLYSELPSMHISRYRQNQADLSEETKKRFNI